MLKKGLQNLYIDVFRQSFDDLMIFLNFMFHLSLIMKTVFHKLNQANPLT